MSSREPKCFNLVSEEDRLESFYPWHGEGALYKKSVLFMFLNGNVQNLNSLYLNQYFVKLLFVSKTIMSLRFKAFAGETNTNHNRL